MGLGGEEDLRTPALHDLAKILLTPPIFHPTVARRGVDIVDAEIERLLDQRHRDIEVVRLFDRRLAAEAENSDLEPGLAEVAGRHRVGSGRVHRQRRHLRRGLRHHPARHEACRRGGAKLQYITSLEFAVRAV